MNSVFSTGRSRFSKDAATWLALIILACGLITCCSGCFSRTIYVPNGKAVRLRADVKAKIWALDASGKPVPGEMTLKDGWWVLPDSGMKE